MRKYLRPLFAVLCLATATAFGFTEGVVYHGRIEAVDANALNEYTPVPMTFRLYGSATGGTVLWGRRHAVPVNTNGVFDVILGSGSGVAVAGAAFDDFADALASVPGAWIGLTPGNASDDDVSLEFSPRQRIVAVPSVQRATVARTSDLLTVPMFVCDTLDVQSNLTVRSLSVGRVSGGIGLSRMRLVMGDGTLRVENGTIRCQPFNPPMTAPSPTTEQGLEVHRLAIGTETSSDVKSVYSTFVPALKPVGEGITHVQQIGSGTTAKGGVQ